MNLSIKDLVEYIKNSLDILVSIKLGEELEKYKFSKNDDITPNSARDYEKLLQKLEQNIREHIGIEHQLKIQCEKFVEKIGVLEEERSFFVIELVSIIFFINNYNIYRKNQKKNLMNKLKN